MEVEVIDGLIGIWFRLSVRDTCLMSPIFPSWSKLVFLCL